VGCGLGDDAEALAARGLDVTAFDISPTAIEWCRKRFPASKVAYKTADLFRADFSADFVLESYTLQSLPVLQRRKAMECIARFAAGTLLVLTRGREPSEDPGKLPWPMTRQELDHFQELGLKEIAFEDYADRGVRRFRVEYKR
jgi:ubiquinone/menaquinone biosynthesis C-methylase UbiE